ncbi:MAG TPA: NBR1-Ig-like domain-containing protein [Anaerolineaceae bacterium]|nr:NBR1-Ig-like domain-containing protein [Anaerolineaceae bacterium]
MHNLKQMPWLIAGLLGLLFMGACGSSNATPTMDANAVYTQAAAVVQIALTNAAALTPSVTVTPISSNTPIPTETVATQSGLPTMPVTLPSITAPAIADKAQWISNDPPDSTQLTPGQTFTLTWKVQNTGTTTWNTNYSVRFYTGTNMGAGNFNLSKAVNPNDVVEIPVQMTAPNNPGKYTTYWVITNDQGVNFRPLSFEFVVNGSAATATSEATQTPTDDSTIIIDTPSIIPTDTPTVKPTSS